MRITPINNINFGRVIEVQNVTDNARSKKNAKELANVLNNIPSLVYTDEQETKIRDFFKATVDDYNEFSYVTARKTQEGYTVLLTGEDAQFIKDLETKYQDKCKEFPKGSLKREIASAEQIQLRDYYIAKKLENGKNNKPYTLISTTSNDDSYSKVSSINYKSCQEEYSYIKDGHMFTKEELKKHKIKHPNKIYIVSYENKTLDLNA